MEARLGLAGLKRLIVGAPNRLPIEIYLKAKPTQNAHVETLYFEGGARLKAPLQTQGLGLMGLFAKWSKMPSVKEFELEEVGAYVWDLCDGHHTTEAIGKKLRERFKMNRLEAETALAAFLDMLSRRKLLTMTIPKRK